MQEVRQARHENQQAQDAVRHTRDARETTMSVRDIMRKEVKAVDAEIKKAKAYFKRTGDRTVAIREDTYLELLNFKLKVLQDVLKRSEGDKK